MQQLLTDKLTLGQFTRTDRFSFTGRLCSQPLACFVYETFKGSAGHEKFFEIEFSAGQCGGKYNDKLKITYSQESIDKKGTMGPVKVELLEENNEVADYYPEDMKQAVSATVGQAVLEALVPFRLLHLPLRFDGNPSKGLINRLSLRQSNYELETKQEYQGTVFEVPVTGAIHLRTSGGQTNYRSIWASVPARALGGHDYDLMVDVISELKKDNANPTITLESEYLGVGSGLDVPAPVTRTFFTKLRPHIDGLLDELGHNAVGMRFRKAIHLFN